MLRRHLYDESEDDCERTLVEDYNAGGGKESYHGLMYQLRLLILFMLRGIANSYSFALATDMKEAFKFDDLVFRHTDHSNNKSKYRFLQAKHRSDDTKKITTSGLLSTSKNSDFSLSVYFESFMKMRTKFKDDEIEDLILCTNIEIKGIYVDRECNKLREDGIFEHRKDSRGDEHVDDILMIKLLYFKKHFDGREKWVAHIRNSYRGNKDNIEADVELFLEKLCFATRQPGVEKLKEIITEEIMEHYNIVEAKFAYTWLEREFNDWMTNPKGTYLTQRDGERYLQNLHKRFGSILFGSSSPVDNFTGRESIIAEVREAYDKGVKTVVITGLGGIGKSQLAKKFIACHRELFDSVVWLNAECYEDLLSSLQRLATERLNIECKTTDGRVKDIKSILEEIYQYFLIRKCVFVFDNVENLEYESCSDWGIENFLPWLSPKPFVLITSRCQTWGSLKIIAVDNFSVREAVNLIRNSADEMYSDEEDLKTLANELAFFPLALQQALAFIKSSSRKSKLFSKGKGVANYLHLLKEENSNILSNKIDNFRGDNYKSTTLTTWNLTLNSIGCRDHGEIACSILKVISYFVPENIKIKDIANTFSSHSQDDIISALCLLHDYSMISLENEVTVHRLVQWVTRRKLQDKGEEEHILKKTLKKHSQMEIENTVSIWSYTMQYSGLVIEYNAIPVFVLTEFCKQFRYEEGYLFGKKYLPMLEQILISSKEQLLKIILALASVTEDHGKYEEAKCMYERAVEEASPVWGEDHLITLYTKKSMANVLRILGKLDEALSIYESILNKEKYALRPDHLDILVTMHSIACVLNNQGKMEEAMSIYDEVLNKRKDLLGEDHLDTINTMHSIACVLNNQGKMEEALTIYERVLNKRKALLGENHLDTLDTMHNIAHALRNSGKWEGTLSIYERVLNKEKSLLGEDHPVTLNTMHNIACVLIDQGKWEEAVSMNKIVLDKRMSALGEDHLDTLNTMHNIAYLLRNQGKWEEAKSIYESVLSKKITLLGEVHPETLITMHNIACVLADQGKWEKAMSINERVLRTRQAVLGDDHPDTLKSMHDVACVLQEQGKLEEATAVYVRVLDRKRAVLGEDHLDTLNTMHNVGYVLCDQGKLEEAMSIFEVILDKRKNALGENHPETLNTMDSVAYVLWKRGKCEEAASMYESVLNIKKAVLGSEHPDTLLTMHNIGPVLSDQGKWEEALSIYEKVLDKRKVVLGDCHPHTLTTMHNIASVLSDRGKWHESMSVYESVLNIKNDIFGENHPETLKTMHNIACVLRKQGRCEEAMSIYRQVLSKRKVVLGEGHPETLRTKRNVESLDNHDKYITCQII